MSAPATEFDVVPVVQRIARQAQIGTMAMALRYDSLLWTLAKSGGHARKRRAHAKKEEQGGKPCSRNCVDPISRLILDLIERATLLGARQGSSRDLDHQPVQRQPEP